VRHAIGDCSAVVAGGHEYDGREIAPLDEGEVRRAAEVMRERRVQATAICSVFSPVRADHEQHAAEICREVLGPDVPLTLSHEIGSIGLLERENAACLNAAVANVAAAAIQALRRAAADAGLHHAKLYLTQNDGTLMSTDYALRFPVRTIACGPTNSIRGATFLTAERDAIIVDIGGTTTLVGVSLRGFPRESAVAVEIGGVRTNFRMPDLLAVGCGGGTVVHVKNGKAKLGPESTGYELVHRGLSWGGDTLTTTDVALAAGYAQVDDPACQPHRLSHVDPQLVPQIVALISQTVRDAVDRMRTNPEPMPMILVGGGGIILSPASYDRIKGVARVIRPTHFQYANAVGAAIAQVSGEVDRLFALDQVSRDDALRQAKEMARQEAVKAGANAGTVEIVEVDEVPLAYLPGNAIRIRVKAVGALVS
jgi:N-methylhydantoinase A/oxoprolinase/acetone carboxylase beta subunit